MKIINEQFFLSTLEDEQNYFVGECKIIDKEYKHTMQPGTYRVIDGELYRIVSYAPEGSME